MQFVCNESIQESTFPSNLLFKTQKICTHTNGATFLVTACKNMQIYNGVAADRCISSKCTTP